MDLRKKEIELRGALEQAQNQAAIAAINVQRIEGAIALLGALLKEEAEGTDEDVSPGD